MKKKLVLLSILFAYPVPAVADPGVFFGAVYNFGGSVGVSLKVLSTNEENQAAFVAGGSYFPTTRKFGIDAGAGYLFKNGAASLGWDFLGKKPQIGIGYVNTKDDNLHVPVNPPPINPEAT